MDIVIPSPSERQREFFRATARYVGYGGARGGGKSWALRVKALLLCLKWPNYRILIIRKTYAELRDNHILPLCELARGAAGYKAEDKVLAFPNGSRIMFGYCDAESDAQRYQGNEYDALMIDEAQQLTYDTFRRLAASVRGTSSAPRRVYLTFNPGGVGHTWLKRLFIDRKYEGEEKPEDYVFIKATVYDNKALLEKDPGYVQMLKDQPEHIRRMWLDGDWDVVAGQFFDRFRRDIHVVNTSALEPHWRRIRALDYGLDMLACLWAAIRDDGSMIIYKELCEPGLIVSEAARRIIEVNGDDDIYCTYAPPDMWSRQKDSGKSMAELFEDNGVMLERADNDRVGGWANLREWLNPVTSPDGEGETAMLTISERCAELIRCLPLLEHDDRRPGDCLTEPHDITHAPDALRYLVQSRPAPKIIKPPPTEADKLREWRKKQINGRKVKRPWMG